MAEFTQKQKGGLYELSDSARAQLIDSKYYNVDLAPTSFSERTWNTYHISMLWVGMSICIPSFMMASGMVGMGLSVWMAVLNVVLGNIIILIPIQLNSHAGTKYGIPFPVFARLTFGPLGAHFPSLSRAITACFWNAVQCSVGGAAVIYMVQAIVPSIDHNAMSAVWIGFLIFLVLTCLLTMFGEKVIKSFESIGSPILLVLSVALLVWAIGIAAKDGISFGELLSTDLTAADVNDGGGFLLVFLGGLTANISFWATMALNIPDFSRYAKSQKTQFRGQLYGMPLTMAFCAIVGAVFAQATFMVYGTAMFDPTEALGTLGDGALMRVVMFVVGFGVIIATLTTNIAANVVAPANGFSNIAPKAISYRIGTIASCVIAIIFFWMMNLSDTMSNFMFSFMNLYGGILAPVAAIFIADYYIVKKRNIDVQALYMGREGRYWYQGGFNAIAFIAWVAGAIIPTLVSAGVLPNTGALGWINANAYIFAFVVAFIIYIIFMSRKSVSFISDEEEAAMTQVV